jgi:hypothetical protein
MLLTHPMGGDHPNRLLIWRAGCPSTRDQRSNGEPWSAIPSWCLQGHGYLSAAPAIRRNAFKL